MEVQHLKQAHVEESDRKEDAVKADEIDEMLRRQANVEESDLTDDAVKADEIDEMGLSLKDINCLAIDIELENMNSFVDFLQLGFQCKLTVGDVFGAKYKRKQKRKSVKSETKALVKKEDEEARCGPDPNSQGYCADCDKQFRSRQGYLTHWKIMHEEKEKILQCDQCDFRTDYAFKLKHHKFNTHESDRNLKTCEHCGKTFTKNYKYRLHVEEVHGDTELFCDKCNYSTKIKRYLRDHVKKNHSEGGPKRPEKELYCEFCSYVSRYQQQLDDHIERKHLNNEYKCDHKDCDYVCNSKRMLVEHKHEHRGEVWPCAVCGKTFPSKKRLGYHRNNSHKPQIERQCEYCDYKSTSLKMFTKHVEWRHSRENYKERYKGWDWDVMRSKWRQGKEQNRDKVENAFVKGPSPY